VGVNIVGGDTNNGKIRKPTTEKWGAQTIEKLGHQQRKDRDKKRGQKF
jgi:hypothetical protein